MIHISAKKVFEHQYIYYGRYKLLRIQLKLNTALLSTVRPSVCPSQAWLDHNDPSKPSHRLTNGPKPSKTIESDGSNIKKPS